MNVAVLDEIKGLPDFEMYLQEKARQIALTPCACDYCENNTPYLLVCNRQCVQGIYERLRKQASK